MPTRQTEVHTYDSGGKVTGTRTVTYEVSEQQVNTETLQAAATQALAVNRAFIGTASPTAAQVTAQVKALSRQSSALIRLLLNQLDATD